MKRTVFMFVASIILAVSAMAQQPGYVSDGALLDGKTIVKANLTSVVLNSYGFSAERILTKNISGSVGFSVKPAGALPFVDRISDMGEFDDEIRKMLEGGKLNTFSFTPEVRIYTGSGYGKGFYLSPYYRYGKIGFNDFIFTVEVEDENGDLIKRSLDMEGSIGTHSIGLSVGYQWLLGKNHNIIIDWTILGGHYGKSSGDFTGTLDGAFPEEYRESAQDVINDTLGELPFIDANATISGNKADVAFKGPWAFLRGGVMIGFRF